MLGIILCSSHLQNKPDYIRLMHIKIIFRSSSPQNKPDYIDFLSVPFFALITPRTSQTTFERLWICLDQPGP